MVSRDNPGSEPIVPFPDTLLSSAAGYLFKGSAHRPGWRIHHFRLNQMTVPKPFRPTTVSPLRIMSPQQSRCPVDMRFSISSITLGHIPQNSF